MDKLGETVEDYAKDHDPLSSAEVEAARALLRHEDGLAREQNLPRNRGKSADQLGLMPGTLLLDREGLSKLYQQDRLVVTCVAAARAEGPASAPA